MEVMQFEKPTASPVLSYKGKFVDRNTDITTAGKLITIPGDSTKDCLTLEERNATPDLVKKFRNYTNPGPGKIRVFHGKAGDPTGDHLTHGIDTKSGEAAGDMVNPAPKTRFAQALWDKKEFDLYASRKANPLGRTHEQAVSFPKGYDFVDKRFGIKNVFDGSAGEVVSPAKSSKQVAEEGEEGYELYKVSHLAYRPGERLDHHYQVPWDKSFGVPTPHDNDGRHVKKTLKWMHNAQMEKGAKVISGRLDRFRERTQPLLGQVHDPIKDTLRVPPDHTFGIMVRPDPYGAGDLLHGRTQSDYLRGKDKERGVLAAIRQHLKKANFHHFHDLSAAFAHYDKNGDGKVDINELREICHQFNVPIEAELLEQLFYYCDGNRDGYIDYTEFANFLNWKDKSRGVEVKDEEEGEKVENLQKQIDKTVGQHRTTSSMINAVVSGVSTKGYRTYGIPTIRSDVRPPVLRRVADFTNYGDEANAHGLLNPSIYSNRGVYEKDFFKPRQQHEVRKIYGNVGVEMDEETFTKVWEAATKLSDSGAVSVESFRHILDQVQNERMQEFQKSAPLVDN